MGKLAVAGASVLAGGGVSAGGVMLSRMFSFDSTLPTTLEKFQEGNGGGCVQSLFPGLQSVSDSGVVDADSNSKIQNNFFDASKKGQSDGCLVVNWDKKSNQDKNWEGNFRFLWAVQQESKGFIVFTTADTTDGSDKKLLWKGVAYSLEKEEGKGWKLSKKRKIPSSGTEKKTDKEATDKKFPKPNTYLTSKAFWGFMDSKDDMEKMCKSSSCTGDMITTDFAGYWTWKGSSGEDTKKLGEWTSNNISGSNISNSWWEELFGKDEWNMGEVVKDMTGKWEEKVWYGIEKPSNT